MEFKSRAEQIYHKLLVILHRFQLLVRDLEQAAEMGTAHSRRPKWYKSSTTRFDLELLTLPQYEILAMTLVLLKLIQAMFFDFLTENNKLFRKFSLIFV